MRRQASVKDRPLAEARTTTAFERIVQAALTASQERQAAALRILLGEVSLPDLTAAFPAAEPYLTARELAAEMSVDPSTIWRWEVPGHELGGRRRYRRSEVDEYLRSEEFARRRATLRAERRMRKEDDHEG